MARNNGYLKATKSPAGDECLTPRYGVEPIVPHLKAKGFKKIWCPFDKEESQYTRVLRRAGFEVVATHLENGEDFFDGGCLDYNCVVSNAPFSKKDAILRRLYEDKKPFAILLPQNSLQSIERVGMFIEYGLEYLGFDRRINFYTRGELEAWKGANHFASGYFCKGVLPSPLVLEKLKPIQEHYLTEI